MYPHRTALMARSLIDSQLNMRSQSPTPLRTNVRRSGVQHLLRGAFEDVNLLRPDDEASRAGVEDDDVKGDSLEHAVVAEL